MTISSNFGFSPENLYKTSIKTRSGKFETAIEPDAKKSSSTSSSANSAQSSEKITGTTINSMTTATTLWQTQNIAQSDESDAIDVEEVAVEKPKSVLEQFKDYMDKSPEELMREEILKSLGYTEEDLAAMDPKERAKVEAQIQDLVETKIEEAMREDGVDMDGVKKATVNQTCLMSPAVV